MLLTVPSAGAETLVVVNGANNLLVFDSASPSSLPQATTAIAGLQAGETLVGIDYRPKDGELYGFSSAGRLYRIDVASGQAAPVGAPSATNPGGHGFDFNPVVDRGRIVNETDQNQRVNPADGSRLVDTNLAWECCLNTGYNPAVSTAAYTNNYAGATATTLWVIDAETDDVPTLSNPNNGVLNWTGYLSGVNAQTGSSGFDIAAADNSGLAALRVGGVLGLYRINLNNGNATLVGNFNPAVGDLRGMAIAPRGLIRFSAAEYGAQENAGNVPLTVTRTGNGPTSVSFRTVAGSATAGSDYTDTSGTLSWGLGDTSSRTIEVPVADDGQAEGEETFAIELTTPTGGAFTGSPSQAQVKLGDPGAPGGSQGTGGGVQTTADLTAPIAALSVARRHKIATVARKGLAFRATCDEACTATTQVTVARRTAKKLKLPRRLLLQQKTLQAGRKTKITLKPRRSTAKRLRRVKRAFKATLSMKLIDAAGNARTVKRTVTLRP